MNKFSVPKNVSLKSVFGKAASVYPEDMKKFPEKRSFLLLGYGPEDVYNANETGRNFIFEIFLIGQSKQAFVHQTFQTVKILENNMKRFCLLRKQFQYLINKKIIILIKVYYVIYICMFYYLYYI